MTVVLEVLGAFNKALDGVVRVMTAVLVVPES